MKIDKEEKSLLSIFLSDIVVLSLYYNKDSSLPKIVAKMFLLLSK